MSIISWNCRGLGNPRTVRILNRLVKDKCPSLVFLMETKCSKARIETVKRCIKFDSCLVVDSKGSSGGLAMLWKDDVKVQLFNFSRWHISVYVKTSANETPWMLTGFYGHPMTSKRAQSWALLRVLKPTAPTAWMCIGDFNEITSQSEKMGALIRPYKQLEAFREAIEFCDLTGLNTRGLKFTWSNRRSGRGFTKERLDRGLANEEWNMRFHNATCMVLPTIKSDHSPLVVSLVSRSLESGRNFSRFRFEAAWSLKTECTAIIQAAWSKATGGSSVISGKLANCSKALQHWNSTRRKEEQGSLRQKMKRIADLQDDDMGNHG
ncbi:uncharacterized protein LOC122274575 [Carya illinoinensis]|uniref:uncharacterized protein LOC122274575 n=1 Tax=Carya illinoinensis TaxID=32201 RepID=UPI001C721FD8|nr:uncharacterized protein LOC122274575 [Carya illinoinensis]